MLSFPGSAPELRKWFCPDGYLSLDLVNRPGHRATPFQN